MKFGRQLAACVLSCVATVAYGDPDPSFVLSTTSTAVDSYFPTYLANGYLSTMTGARGTESNLAYLVAFMDYTKEDIARPAAIPGWSGIDYSTGKSSAGEFWLNNVKLGAAGLRRLSPDARHVRRHADDQLPLHGRQQEEHRRPRSSPSPARPRRTWRPTQLSDHPGLRPARCSCSSGSRCGRRISRVFRSARMSGEEMQAAVAANAMNVLEPLNHATPDRAPVWYYGHTAGARRAPAHHALTLWLDGRPSRASRWPGRGHRPAAGPAPTQS